eukprot:XP_025002028.1 uncharacterized protein LOC112531287 [Gallus gallus]
MLGGALAKTSLTNLRNGCEFLANTVRDFLPAARICPEETVQFLQSQLGADREAGCVAALGLLAALARSDEPTMTEKLPQVVEAVQCLCSDPRIQVRRAILHFIKDVLSANARSCSAWDVVGHIFSEFSRTTGRRAAGDLSAQEAQEEGALQELCMDILGSLDVSASGMSKVSHNLTCCHSLPSHHVFLIPFQHPRSLLQCALKHTRLREIHRVLFISERRQEC